MFKMSSRICTVGVALVLSVVLACPVSFAASEIDALMQVLIAKGVISRGEAIQILEEANTVAQVQKVEAIKDGPKWLANTTFKGDLRLRLQMDSKEGQSDGKDPRYRLRTRFRYGLTNEINDTLTVGARFATGQNTGDDDGSGATGDARSTNQSWGDVFENWKFNIDEAYFDWHPFQQFQLIGGKREVKAVMHRVSDLLWDGDITMDGGTVKVQKEIADGVQLFAYAGGYVLDQEKFGDDDNENPWMYQIQPGIAYNVTGDGYQIKTSAAFAYTSAQNIEGRALLDGNGAGSNNTTVGSKYVYSYNTWNPNFTFDYLWGGSKNDRYVFGVFGDYVFNPDPQDTGFLFGVKTGYAKTGKQFGDWQLKYNYRYLENDAFLDVLSDSDAYGGKTDTQGHELALSLGLAENVSLGFDYYMMETIHADRKTENLFQVDLLFKF